MNKLFYMYITKSFLMTGALFSYSSIFFFFYFFLQVINMLNAVQDNSPANVVQVLDRVIVSTSQLRTLRIPNQENGRKSSAVECVFTYTALHFEYRFIKTHSFDVTFSVLAEGMGNFNLLFFMIYSCLLYTSPSPRDS